MSQFPLHNQTSHLARETVAASEKSGDRTLKIMGLAALILTSAAGLVHGVRQFWKDIAGSRSGHGGGNGHGNGYVSQAMPERDPRPGSAQRYPQAGSYQRPWTGRHELSSRKPEADHAQAAQRSRSHFGQER